MNGYKSGASAVISARSLISCYSSCLTLVRYFYIVGLLFSVAAYGLSVHLQTLKVSPDNADDLGVLVKIYENDVCDKALEVFVNFPIIYKGSRLRSANVGLDESGELLFESTTVIAEFSDFAGFEDFHGVTFCVSSSLLEDVHVSAFFGLGEVNTHVLEISGLVGWRHEQ